MRKKILSCTLLIFNIAAIFLFNNQVHSQSIEDYELLTNIFYRDATIEPITEYMKERCVLDIYYPKNKSGYATVIWFHGRGLKAGNKFIPEWLKDQGICVVSVNYRFYPEYPVQHIFRTLPPQSPGFSVTSKVMVAIRI